ncbi:MAG: zinc ribbon domain-containing protein [Candidatus Rokubacteria bacterium]|jgi:putative FmdB family regulatory protein|nr:zinc ribbon domain-containing protein [Candidatus Rokubacteria bacterium]
MPIYEYLCADCRRRVSLLVMRISDPGTPHCPRCGGERLTRLMSRFATIRSEDDRLESLADPGQLGDLDENDPRSVARWMKKMGGELGEDVGEDWDQMVDETVEQEEAGGEVDAAEASGASDDL